MSTPTATYLYCLLRRPEAPDVPMGESAPPGVPGASRPRVLPVEDGLWLVTAQVPLPAYGEDAIASRMEDLDWLSARALGHEAMVEHLAGGAGDPYPDRALIPMKLLTLFSDDERALEHVRGDLPRLRPILDRVAGREEWGVRVSYDPKAARESLGSAGGENAPASGKDFLLRKKRVRDAGRSAPEAARRAAEETFDALAARAVESSRRAPAAGNTLLLDAAFLVPRADHDAFEAAVDAAARELAGSHCELTLTGPWPPYNFSRGASGEPPGDR
jgi:hypothetical protein